MSASHIFSSHTSYDEGYDDAAGQVPIWVAVSSSALGLAADHAYIEGYVSYFSVEDQAWVRTQCWACRAYARGYSEQRPSSWGLNELPILTVVS